MRRRIVVCATACASIAAALAAPFGIGFTYQGHLLQGGAPVSGVADVRFQLFNAAVGGVAVSSLETFTTPVADGLFTVADIDFTQGVSVFDGNDVWLQVSVAFPAGGAFTPLSPRQRIAPTPYALQTRGLFVNQNLQVGIGTTAPSCDLEVVNQLCVSGGSGANGVIQVRDNNGQLDAEVTSATTGGGSVELFNASGQPRAQLIASQSNDNGGYLWLRQADGGSGVIIDGEANGNGSGLVSVRESSGQRETVALIGSATTDDDGSIEIRDGNGNTDVEIDASTMLGGSMRLTNASGAQRVGIHGDDSQQNGSISVRSQAGQSVFLGGGQPTTLTAPYQIGVYNTQEFLNVGIGGGGAGGSGFVTVYEGDNLFGSPRASILSSGGGLIRAYNEDDAIRVEIDGDQALGGRVSIDAADGSETVELLGESNNGGGSVYVRNNTSETTVELRGDENSQNSGYIGVFNRTGTNNFAGIGMDALDSFGTGAQILLRASNGTGTLELDGEDGQHGEIALWDNTGTRTFRIFGNTMTIYNDAGAATWSINGNGAKNAVVQTRDYGQRLMYTMESPEVWFEEVGGAQLVNGVARVDLEPIFLQTVTIDEKTRSECSSPSRTTARAYSSGRARTTSSSRNSAAAQAARPSITE